MIECKVWLVNEAVVRSWMMFSIPVYVEVGLGIFGVACRSDCGSGCEDGG